MTDTTTPAAPAAPEPVTRAAVEIAVQDAAGARTALAAGADRVELCAALVATGGLTPSTGTVARVVATGIPVHVLVRPRGGGFVYTREELDVTADDVRAVLAAGAAGVVVGALDRHGRVDVAAVAALVAAAGGGTSGDGTAGGGTAGGGTAGPVVTFHRALDVVPDPVAALEQLVGLGVHRVLTSGGAVRSVDGAEQLAALVAASSGRIEVVAGGGVRLEDVPALLATGVHGIHLSARRTVADTATGPGGGASERDVTDAALASAVVTAVRTRA